WNAASRQSPTPDALPDVAAPTISSPSFWASGCSIFIATWAACYSRAAPRTSRPCARPPPARGSDVEEVCYATRGLLSEAPPRAVSAALLRLVAGSAQGTGRAAPWAAPVHHLSRCRHAGGSLLRYGRTLVRRPGGSPCGLRQPGGSGGPRRR